MPEQPAMRDAIVFLARDFLSVEFPRMSAHFADLARVYIVVSEAEARAVRAGDPAGEVVRIGSFDADPGSLEDMAAAVNMDRFLRYLDGDEVIVVLRTIAGVCEHILSRYRVLYYMDEPVSGYANDAFNRAFSSAGALCMHFQTSWLPGFAFFVSDKAQDAPLRLDLLSGGAELVREHVRRRQAGLGRPLYVLGYGKLRKRVADLATTAGKIAYRKLFRRNALYIDRDASAHRFHVRCLWHSLGGRYSPDPARQPPRKYVIFPLHYEPESLLNYFSPYSRQEEIAAQILDTLPPDYTLVLKEHPSQPGALHLPKWAEVRQAKRVVCLRGDYRIADLLVQRPVVVSIGSTFALEAALAGCPVGMLGGAHFQHAPGITRLLKPTDWLSLIDAPTGSAEAIIEWYGAFQDRYCFRGTIMRDRTDMPDLAAAITALRAAATSQVRSGAAAAG
jgi:hypothetical protein